MEFLCYFIVYLKREIILIFVWLYFGRWFGWGVWSCLGWGCRCFLFLFLLVVVYSCWLDSILRCFLYDCKYK